MTGSQLAGRLYEAERRIEKLERIIGDISDSPVVKKVSGFGAAQVKGTVKQKFGNNLMDRMDNSHECMVPRHIAMYLMRTILKMSFPQIGKQFVGHGGNGMHHTTVFHAFTKISHQRTYDNKLDQLLAELEAELKA